MAPRNGNPTPYEQTIRWLYDHLPAYQRIGKQAFKKDLTNIRLLCSALGQPHTKFPSIHIAGTNGKGSVAHMLAAIFQAAGYRTGLYTSPHLVDFRERIKVNGRMISKNSVIAFTRRIQRLAPEVRPSFFEMTVALAFDHFRRQRVDIAIVETGLGGRLDSTNIITPLLSVITNISLEHCDMLGDTLAAIAGEKAGIIKPGVPVVIGRRHPETAPVFEAKAAKENAPLRFAEDNYTVSRDEYLAGRRSLALLPANGGKPVSLRPGLTAAYQVENVRTVLAAIDALPSTAGIGARRSDVIKGIENVVALTGFSGRWQLIGTEPAIILDGAHNTAGIQALLPQLSATPYDHLHIVYGCVQDKDLDTILPLLPDNASYYLTEPDVERKKPLDSLVEAFGKAGRQIAFADPSPKRALAEAKRHASGKSLILITGSLFLLGSFLPHRGGR